MSHLFIFLWIILHLLHPIQTTLLRAGDWEVQVTVNGTIAAISSKGMDITLLDDRGSNLPTVINGETGAELFVANAAKCSVTSSFHRSSTRETLSFCYNISNLFDKKSITGQVFLYYNLTVSASKFNRIGDEASPGSLSILQDISLTVSGPDEGLVVILQLPMSTQPNQLTHSAQSLETRLSDGRDIVYQLCGNNVNPNSKNKRSWTAEYAMSESGFATIIDDNSSNEVPRLALPMVITSASGAPLRIAQIADPFYSTALKFSTGYFENERRIGQNAMWQSVYNASKNALNTSNVVRRFASVVYYDHSNAWADAVDIWYQTVLPDLPSIPSWTQGVGLTHFDFFTKNGSAWRADVDFLTERLSFEERGRVVFAQEGWYDTQGDYSYDFAQDKFQDRWTFAPASPFWVPATSMKRDDYDCSSAESDCKSNTNITEGGYWNCSQTSNSCDHNGNPKVWAVNMTIEKVRQNLEYAKSKGFRVLLYFADGLLVCKNARTFDKALTLPDRLFDYQATHMADCACPPGQKFCNSMLNPVLPKVKNFFVRYIKALLRTFGDVIDGFVWDETFYILPDNVSMIDAAGGCVGTHFLRLVQELTKIVHEYNRELVFLASDVPEPRRRSTEPCQDFHCANKDFGMTSYGIVTDGQFPDFEVGNDVFPAYTAYVGNKRHPSIWSCNWEPVLHLERTITAAMSYSLPASLGMTYHTSNWPNVGISGMTKENNTEILRLFHRKVNASKEKGIESVSMLSDRIGDEILHGEIFFV